MHMNGREIAVIRTIPSQRLSINIWFAMKSLNIRNKSITAIEREIVIFNTQKSHFRDGDDAEYFETATENPLQHTANASAIRGMHIWNSPTPAAPV